MEKYTEQVNARVTPEQKRDLHEVSAFSGVKPTELLRQLIREHLMKVKGSRAFQIWKKEREVTEGE